MSEGSFPDPVPIFLLPQGYPDLVSLPSRAFPNPRLAACKQVLLRWVPGWLQLASLGEGPSKPVSLDFQAKEVSRT